MELYTALCFYQHNVLISVLTYKQLYLFLIFSEFLD